MAMQRRVATLKREPSMDIRNHLCCNLYMLPSISALVVIFNINELICCHSSVEISCLVSLTHLFLILSPTACIFYSKVYILENSPACTYCLKTICLMFIKYCLVTCAICILLIKFTWLYWGEGEMFHAAFLYINIQKLF